ncbi:copper resistance CopC family protein [Bacillus sp. FJAT-27251]|uniref:copper resistance CopC family protein n=1 Tax=Bacillus sp. FJAT-27251 TaxID=1684142 RepID=UPI0006A7E9DF|nr:copper resistance CopC family protein [Bacillus sp. FJAT-27251]
MRKMVVVLLALLVWGLAAPAKAHTGLETSLPKEGETVTQPIQEVVLTFNTEIEALSTMQLFRADDTEMPLHNLTIDRHVMKADLGQDLKNGSYVINWKIVGKDGHPIEGKVNFQVQMKEESAAPETGEAAETPETPETPENKEEAPSVVDEEVEENSNSFFPLLIIGLAIVLAASFLIMRKKK